MVAGHWLPVRDGDPRARALFARHYSATLKRSQPLRPIGNGERFAGPGAHMVLLLEDCQGMFVWRAERFRLDGQTGIYCSIFRNESPVLSSDLIREACELAWQRWPGERLFTYVADAKIRSTNPGYSFKCAGWRRCGRNADGRLTILELLPDAALGTLNRTALSPAG
jgi:hypothetical protein